MNIYNSSDNHNEFRIEAWYTSIGIVNLPIQVGFQYSSSSWIIIIFSSLHELFVDNSYPHQILKNNQYNWSPNHLVNTEYSSQVKPTSPSLTKNNNNFVDIYQSNINDTSLPLSNNGGHLILQPWIIDNLSFISHCHKYIKAILNWLQFFLVFQISQLRT